MRKMEKQIVASVQRRSQNTGCKKMQRVKIGKRWQWRKILQ